MVGADGVGSSGLAEVAGGSIEFTCGEGLGLADVFQFKLRVVAAEVVPVGG